jgi:hypothetical protein
LFDPVPIEFLRGLGPLRVRQLAQVLELAVRQPIGLGLPLLLLPGGAFADAAKVDHQISHLRVSTVTGYTVMSPCIAANCAAIMSELGSDRGGNDGLSDVD